jgi:RNA polymerase sigma-70 factor (ECF subfamily)
MGFWDYKRRKETENADTGLRVDPAAEVGVYEDPDLAIQKEWLLQARIDRERFDYFYNHFYPRILRYCYCSVWHRDDAEDLAAETFQAAFTDLWKFRWQGVSFGAWLYRIASNRIKKWHRQRMRHPQVPLPENLLGEVLLVGRDIDPERRLEIAQEVDRLAGYMARLSPEEQVYLNLYYREGLSSREVSAIVDRKWGTIASRITRARRKLQDMATEDDERSQ